MVQTVKCVLEVTHSCKLVYFLQEERAEKDKTWSPTKDDLQQQEEDEEEDRAQYRTRYVCDCAK